MDIPEDVGGDGIQAHGFGHAQAIAPVRAWNAGVVHFAGDDLEGLAIEEEFSVGGTEGGLLRAGGAGRDERDKNQGRTSEDEAKTK